MIYGASRQPSVKAHQNRLRNGLHSLKHLLRSRSLRAKGKLIAE